jgi:hypothetical protein
VKTKQMGLNFLKILVSPNKEILDLLNNNIIGTPGQSMLYQHLGIKNKIHQIADPYYACLMKNDRVVGTACFCRRPTANTGGGSHSYYIRYFSFKEIFRRRSFRARPLPLRQSNLRVEINLVLGGYGLNVPVKEKFFHYAYVDPRNVRSLALCNEFGFETVREYATVVFNRINPKRSPALVTAVPKEEEHHIGELIRAFYKDYTMFSDENLLRGRKYYVLKDHHGKILAGAQVNPERWKILALPGLRGKFILQTFTYLPFLRKLFNKDFKFITLDGIYYAAGFEKTLEILIEGLLAKHGVNSAIMVVDAGSKQYHDLKSLDLGLVNKLSPEVRGNVICRFSNFSSEEKKLFRIRPAYISGIDVT